MLGRTFYQVMYRVENNIWLDTLCIFTGEVKCQVCEKVWIHHVRGVRCLWLVVRHQLRHCDQRRGEVMLISQVPSPTSPTSPTVPVKSQVKSFDSQSEQRRRSNYNYVSPPPWYDNLKGRDSVKTSGIYCFDTSHTERLHLRGCEIERREVQGVGVAVRAVTKSWCALGFYHRTQSVSS